LGQPSRHPLRGLLTAQFLGSFNNNALKWFVALLAVETLSAGRTLSTQEREALQQTQETWAFVIFTLPFVLISLPGGVLADRLSKRTVLMAMKALECATLIGAGFFLMLNPAGGPVLLLFLLVIGVAASIFSPAMYGTLPEILPHDKLSSGNGLLAMWSFLAIIAGTGAGGALLDATRGGSECVAVFGLALLSLAGFFAARTIERVPPARAQGGVAETVRLAWTTVRADRVLGLTVLGQGFYWTIVSLVGQTIPVFARRLVDGSASANTLQMLPLLVLALGTAAGSVVVGRLSAGKVEVGFIPLGGTGITLCTLLLGLLGPEWAGMTGTLLLMALLGACSGFVNVPLSALLQWRSPPDRRGAVIAFGNVLSFLGILIGSLLAMFLAWADLDSRGILIAAAVLTMAGTVWATYLLPVAFLRLVLVLLTHTFYRLRVIGRENVPLEGGALLTPNHVTFVDALFLVTSIDRPIRFLVDASYFNHWLFRPFMLAGGAIPISASGGPRMILRALKDAGAYLDKGDVVCIFPEGQLTRTGTLQPFQRGLERIVKGRHAPIIPVYMDRVWGSIFSRAGGRFLWKIPERLPYPITVAFGTPLPPGTPIADVRRAVQDLSEIGWRHRKEDAEPLHHRFRRVARHHPFEFALVDASRPPVTRFRALSGAVALARALMPRWAGQEYVGILLPPSVAGALVNVAASLAGRISVNLNYTSGRAGMSSAARQSNLRTVVTSRAFLEKAKLELPEGVEPIWIEEVAAGLGFRAQFIAGVLAAFAPVRLLEKACGATRQATVDDIATVIFSSGSTGEPKGVLLSHFNVGSNVQAAGQIFRLEPDDRLLGILPLFHSFGYLSLWFASTQRLGMILHPSPLDAGVIGELVQRFQATLLLATPTFLQIYMRRCTPAQFGSLRIVLAGAEKLSERLVQAFEENFGIRPLEGYGTTECSPVVAASTLDYRAAGFYQPGSRRGFVGQPLPGVSVRIVDPDTFAPQPPMTPGMLLVKGPNVMRGYLGRDDLTAKVMRDGWYVTGDMALVDEDGFLKITDRLSRFSKIGGEMVPHGRVEEALQEAAGTTEQSFAVTAVPDERKGERLAVLYTLDEGALPTVLEKLAASGLPNLFIPRRDQFVKVAQLPMLGIGKLDLREVKRIATEALAGAAPTETK
jgi:acyl-[acyl-carrier-protein]-phospholipid O-acyltransferase/long-chain-fatty-acid--[acyl-carrier-protein] ligase